MSNKASDQHSEPKSGSGRTSASTSKTGAKQSKSKSTNKHTNKAAGSDKKTSKGESQKTEPWVAEETITGLFDRISDITNSAFSFARKTTDTSYRVGKALIQSQDQLKLMLAAGQSLKDLREVAGLTISELNDALQLKDKSLLEAVENGTATLSFELILRLSALLARNDPIPFILKYSRTYSPETWKLLHDWGAGRLPLQYQREREFINIFRCAPEPGR
jgi:transcriptional regulator with XRE-family HTH domain